MNGGVPRVVVYLLMCIWNLLFSSFGSKVYWREDLGDCGNRNMVRQEDGGIEACESGSRPAWGFGVLVKVGRSRPTPAALIAGGELT